MSYEAESPKAHATKLYEELVMHGHDRSANVAKLAQAFREWEARGLERMAAVFKELPHTHLLAAVIDDLLVRAKELRSTSIHVA